MILGLKPATREDEGRVVKGWMSREKKRGYQLGQTWYLISQSWWNKWLDYVSDNVSFVPPSLSSLSVCCACSYYYQMVEQKIVMRHRLVCFYIPILIDTFLVNA